MKNNLIQELSQRKKTDRYLSFGTYIVVICRYAVEVALFKRKVVF